MSAKEQILVCPHCGNKASQEIKCTALGKEEIELDPGNVTDAEIYTYFVQCKTCLETSIYTDWEYGTNPGNLAHATLLYPSVKKLMGIPKAIQDSYAEAKRIQKISPIAFAVLIRKVLEYLCKDQNASGASLKQQLEDLADINIIPATLVRMTNALRYLGNLGAHSSEIKIGAEEAQIMDDFFVAVVEYVYVAPEKLRILNEKLKNKNSANSVGLKKEK